MYVWASSAPLHRLVARRCRVGAARGDLVDAFNLAVDLERAGDIQEAERWYGRRPSGGDPEATNNLALLLDRTGRKQETLPLLVRAAKRGDAKSA